MITLFEDFVAQPAELKALAQFASDNDSDYGHTFLHKDGKRLFVCMGDSSEYWDEFKQRAVALGYEPDGEGESYPMPEDDWTEVEVKPLTPKSR